MKTTKLNCRGRKNRINIVKEYEVTPVANLKLLNGDIIKSNANNDITDHYYIFEYKSKTTNEVGFIYCGEAVAKDFSILINKPLPRLYNILRGDENVRRNAQEEFEIRDSNQNIKWNPERKQLYNAVMIFFIYWKRNPNSPIYNIKNKLENYVERTPYINYIKSVNTIIKNTGKTLRNIILELEDRGNNLRDFNFDLIKRRLEQENIEQYFE